jgi:hypothetical protein
MFNLFQLKRKFMSADILFSPKEAQYETVQIKETSATKCWHFVTYPALF